MQLDIFSLRENPVSEERDFNYCLIEASHYVMALNFVDEFQIKSIDLSENTGLKINRDSKKALTPTIYDHLALMNISGLCALSIDQYGAQLIANEMHKFPEDATYMSLEGNESAYASFKKNLLPVSRAFLLKPRQTEWSTILYAFKFFLCNAVNEAVYHVSSILQNALVSQISHKAIFDQLSQQEFYADFCLAMTEFKNNRYPLTKNKFSI